MDALCGSKIKILKFEEPFLRFFDLMSEKAFDIDCEEMTKMEDSRIVELYWRRSGDAIAETSRKYGGYCYAIAYNLLSSVQDAEECVNDTWLGAWNSMPDNRPNYLAPFLGKIARSLAFNRFRAGRAEKNCLWCWRSWESVSLPFPAPPRQWRTQSWRRRLTAFSMACRAGTVMCF